MKSFAKPPALCIDVTTAARCLVDSKFSARYAERGVSKWSKSQEFLGDKDLIKKMIEVKPERLQFH